MRDFPILIPEIFTMLCIHLDFFSQMFLKNAFNKITIIQRLQARFFLSFQKHSKSKTNILRYANYIGEIKIPDAWLQILKNDGIGAFRLTHFYKYKFPANLKNIEMNLYDFVYMYNYDLQRFEIQDKFSDYLKKLLNSTTNISNASHTIPTPQNLKEIFMSDKEKQRNKK